MGPIPRAPFGGGGSSPPPPPPSGGADFLEVLKAPKKFSGPNELVPKAPEKIFDRPKAWKKIWPNLLGGGGGGHPPPPSGAELLGEALPNPRYGIQMRVHDRRCSAQSRSAKQKSKRKALQ